MEGKTIQRNLAEACEEYNKIFGANKNLYRITCSMQDGCKPVMRRFLYSLYTGKNNTTFVKMAKAAADTAARFHPHGNVSVEEVGGKMANPTCNNVLLLDGQGNFGSYKSDDASASRYIECRLSKYSRYCFFKDFELSNVDMKPSYAGTEEEPEYLPARYPNALFNPQLSGIGYGFASNIPPFNVTEVMETTIKLIKNPNAKVFLVPDSPTGADIVDDGQFKDICDTGTGTFTLRGHVDVDEIHNTLTITSIPLQTTIDAIIRKIVELKDKKIFDEIESIKDYTKNATGVRTIIQLKSTANPYETVKKLYTKGTGLKKTYPVGLKMIDDYQDYDYSVKTFLLAWIDYRRDTVRSMYNTKLVKAMEAQNINDILLFILNGKNAEETVKICKSSNDKKEIATKLMQKYPSINSQQANTIADMHMHQLSQGAYEGYKVRREELKKEIKDTEAILDDDAQLDEIIIDQLKEGIKLFGGPRRSSVVKDDEEEIPEGDHILAVSKDGYIKKVALENRTIGQVGNFGGNYMTTKVSNLDNIFIFDSRGMVTKLSVNNIPDMVIKDIGVPVERFIPNCGKIVSALVEPTKADRKKLGKDLFITFLSKTGYIKKTNLDEFANISGSATAIKLPANDELIDTIFTTDNTRKDMIIYTNKGNGIRRDINEFSVMKANAHGSRQLVLADGEYCVGFNKIDPEKKYLFYMTSSGRAKLTETKYFPAMKKTDDVLSLINLEKSETLVTILSVNKKDKVIVYRKNNQPETISASDVSVLTRAAKAEKIVKTPKGDCVLSCAVISR